MGWHAPANEEFTKLLQHILASQASGYFDRQAFPSVLIKDVQHAKSPTIISTTMNEIITPHMVLCRSTQPYA
jgi:hypothetical protein